MLYYDSLPGTGPLLDFTLAVSTKQFVCLYQALIQLRPEKRAVTCITRRCDGAYRRCVVGLGRSLEGGKEGAIANSVPGRERLSGRSAFAR
ncbi:MAG: hypothetical protein ACRD1O_03710 [Terriglobia bacterium]